MKVSLFPVFARLKAILHAYAEQATVVHDSAEHFYLNAITPDAKGKPRFLAAAKIGTTKVAFHLMPLYSHPELLDSVSVALKKRMQGKSCFNFSSIDETLLFELEELTRQAMASVKT